MRRLIIIITLICFSIVINAQNDSLPELKANFSSLIVKDITNSINWYSENLGFTLANKNEYSEMGFKQANLLRGQNTLEIIELKTAVLPEKVIPDYNPKTRLIGYFKSGYLVSEFDKWVQHLKNNKVNFHGRVVTDKLSGKRMLVIKDPDGKRIQLFEK